MSVESKDLNEAILEMLSKHIRIVSADHLAAFFKVEKRRILEVIRKLETSRLEVVQVSGTGHSLILRV